MKMKERKNDDDGEEHFRKRTGMMKKNNDNREYEQQWRRTQPQCNWVLHIAKVAYFFSSSLPNVEWAILEPLPFFFYQKLFIFRFLENCF